MRKTAALLAFLAIAASSAEAQVLDSARTEAVRSRGFIRAAETQLTKTLELIDRIEVHPDGTVDTFFVYDTIPGDTIYADELVPDSAPPDWMEDDRQLFTYFAWGDSAATFSATGDSLLIAVPLDRFTMHLWPVFMRDSALFVPTKDGWLPATRHPTEPWVCVNPADERESYSFKERVVAAGISLGLKVAEWTVPIEPEFAKGLDRLPPTCPDIAPAPTDSTPPPMPTGVTLAQEDAGLRISWDAPPAGIDTVLVDWGWDGEPTKTHLGSGMLTNMLEPVSPGAAVRIWACVKFKRDGINSEQRCNHVDWVP